MNTEKWRIVEHNWSDTTIYDQNHNVVCRISIADDATEDNQEELEKIASQRARLIAAAPEMLAALEQLLDATECGPKGMEGMSTLEGRVAYIEKLRPLRESTFAIIKKAKGENQ